MQIRGLTRDELDLVRTIDRSEVIDGVYYLENDELVLKPEHWELQGWPPGEIEPKIAMLRECYDRGGTFWGAFEDGHMVGVAALDATWIGRARDQLPLEFLHVSHAYRRRGLGRALFQRASDHARDLGARRLYISATPSENTIGFYRHLGCFVTPEVDPHLFELEPEDIHLEYHIPPKEGEIA
jgi:GNAT superfamily N-acetyltransferase